MDVEVLRSSPMQKAELTYEPDHKKIDPIYISTRMSKITERFTRDQKKLSKVKLRGSMENINHSLEPILQSKRSKLPRALL